MLKGLFASRLSRAMLAAAFVLLVGAGAAYANDVKPLGLNETHNYPINVYAVTTQYNADKTRALSARGYINANISGTKTIQIRVANGSGSVLTSPVTITSGTKRIFTNSYGGVVRTQPQVKAVSTAHQVQGTWTYRDL